MLKPMGKIFRLIYALIFIFMFSKYLSAQSINIQTSESGVTLNHIGIEQGLSQSTVYAIVQDREGFMWFGTDDGLNRYDGYSVKIFKHSTTDSNSIADNTILSLLSDKKGDLWIGTRRGGADRYVISENKFYHYGPEEKNKNTIEGNAVHTIFQDTEGNIWLGTNKGLNLYNRNNDSFTYFHFVSNNDTVTQAISINTIREDESHNLWLGTSGGLYKINLNVNKLALKNSNNNVLKANLFKHTASKKYSLSGNFIRSFFINNSDSLWVGTYGAGLNRFNIADKKFYNNLNKTLPSLYSNIGNFISSIFKDSRGNLWIAAFDKGLNVLNNKTKKFMHFISDPVLTIYEDRSGIIWIGTFTDGVKMYDPRINRFNRYYDNAVIPDEKDNNLITSILESNDNYLWIGTYGGGLKLYSQQNKNGNRRRYKIATFRFEPNNHSSISSNRIVSLAESADGRIWIGTENDGLNCYYRKTGKFIRYKNIPGNINSISSNQITTMYYDTANNILWIGYLNSNIDAFNLSTNLIKHYRAKMSEELSGSKNSITLIYKGKKTGIWIGTFEGDINRYKAESDSFYKYNLPTETNIKEGKNGIYSMYEDDNGQIWIGTYGGGLIRLNIKNNSVKNYTEQNGLSNDVVYGILPDKRGNLWLSTNKGLSKFNPKKNEFRNYDVKDGLQSNEFNQGSYFEDKDGELFFGGVNGFNEFYPKDINNNMYIPPVYITTFRVFDKILPYSDPITPDTKTIELSYFQNFFSFNFVALNYTSPDKDQYAFKLEGFDKNWHNVTAQQRFASYTNLDPGKYILHVIASNNDGIWNKKGTSISIIITPPFWMTWWFRILAIILLISGAGSIIRYFVLKNIKEKTRKAEQEAALERERLRIARDIHDDLGSRLTEIQLISEMAYKEPDRKAAQALHEVSETARNIISTFSEIVWSVSPQNDTVENLAEYIGQYAVDFLSKAHIKCRLDLPGIFPDWKASSEIRHNTFLAVKEALNNSAKHSGTKEMHIKVSVNDHVIFISVRDFGSGFEQKLEQKSGNGLTNMTKRMEQIGGKCEVESKKELGTMIRFSVPLMV